MPIVKLKPWFLLNSLVLREKASYFKFSVPGWLSRGDGVGRQVVSTQHHPQKGYVSALGHFQKVKRGRSSLLDMLHLRAGVQNPYGHKQFAKVHAHEPGSGTTTVADRRSRQ